MRAILHMGPKYSASAKLPAIERLLPKTGDNPLANTTSRLSDQTGRLSCFDRRLRLRSEPGCLLSSAAAAGPDWGDGQPADATLAGAVHASTNAPVNYFDAPWFSRGLLTGIGTGESQGAIILRLSASSRQSCRSFAAGHTHSFARDRDRFASPRCRRLSSGASGSGAIPLNASQGPNKTCWRNCG